MNPGKRRHIVTIQKATGTADSYGAETLVWSTHAKQWAEIWTTKTSEYVIGDKLTASSLLIFRMKYIAGVTEAMRILKGSAVYEILGIRNIEERNIMLELTCRKNG